MSDQETQEGVEQEWSRERRKDILECPLSPASLVGSWFHKLEDDQVVWQGLVLAEPQPGLYLVELLDWTQGQARYQRIVRVESMTSEEPEWRFYDSDEWMRRGFEDPSAAEPDRIRT